MRLISCYIENFGGLHQYFLSFQPQITVLQEENGFGKTTLAEFIRAMFYGFPRAGRNLSKNTRKKYTPWQGGSFGGNLIFEHGGRRYRIDRSFGTTPKGDSFSLTDAQTHQKCDDFSENIGLELFGLDSDSFERSTYLPQEHENGPLATGAIQARLTSLLQDSDDIGSFDKAVTALKSKRSAYLPYRGNGGSFYQAQAHISDLQVEISQREPLLQQLEQIRTDTRQLYAQRAQEAGRLEAVRADLLRASQAVAHRTITDQYNALRQSQAQEEQTLDQLRQIYPNGLPGEDELHQIGILFDRCHQAAASRGNSAEETALQERALRLEGRIPAPEEFSRKQQAYQDLLRAGLSLDAAVLSEEEQQQMAQLQDYFRSGVPSDEGLEQMNTLASRLQQKNSDWAACCLSEEEEGRLAKLHTFFAPGVPEQAALQQQRENLRSALEQPLSPEKPAPVRRSPLPLILGLIGVLAAAAGIVMMALRSFAVGGGALCISVPVLIGAVYLSLRQALRKAVNDQASSGQNPALRHQRLASVRSFTDRFLPQSPDLGQALQMIQEQLDALTALTGRREALEARRAELTREAEALEAQLRQLLEPYGAELSFDSQLPAQIRTNRELLAALQRKNQQQNAARRDIQTQIDALQAELSAFLAPFYGPVSPDEFGGCLRQLQRDCDAWEADQKQARLRQQQLQENQQALAPLIQAYQLDLSDPESLTMLRRDAARWYEALHQAETRQEEIDAFYQAHQQVLSAPVETYDLEGLQAAETAHSDQITLLTQEILDNEQRIRNLTEKTDELPSLRDELEHWMQCKQQSLQNSALLDQTLEFLEKAKEQLSVSYLGPIRQSFCRYAEHLEDSPAWLVSPDLSVQADRLGKARELGYFSAGQADLADFCMRLALADALFQGRPPLLILDDPFVNLDDAHMKQAASLLRFLGSRTQILYLICHSSRSLPSLSD